MSDLPQIQLTSKVDKYKSLLAQKQDELLEMELLAEAILLQRNQESQRANEQTQRADTLQRKLDELNDDNSDYTDN